MLLDIHYFLLKSVRWEKKYSMSWSFWFVELSWIVFKNFLLKYRPRQGIWISFSRLIMNFVFQGGPYHDPLHNILGAYACYRPDVGYVQGMSFLAATLLLNMDETDAFIAFSNLLNRPAHMAFFRVDQPVVRPFCCVYLSIYLFSFLLFLSLFFLFIM